MRNTKGGKPYDVCLKCPHLGTNCDGPNFLAMTFERWVEWVKARALLLNMTHQNIADKANLPKGTIDSILSGKNTDVRRDTMAAITHAVTGHCWGQYPCHNPVDASKEMSELIKLSEEKDKEIHKLQSTVEKIEDYEQKKIDFLKEQLLKREAEIQVLKDRIVSKEKTIYRAVFVAAGFAVLLIVVLGIDFFSPAWGMFRN